MYRSHPQFIFRILPGDISADLHVRILPVKIFTRILPSSMTVWLNLPLTGAFRWKRTDANNTVFKSSNAIKVLCFHRTSRVCTKNCHHYIVKFTLLGFISKTRHTTMYKTTDYQSRSSQVKVNCSSDVSCIQFSLWQRLQFDRDVSLSTKYYQQMRQTA